jgi:hypothetical protein
LNIKLFINNLLKQKLYKYYKKMTEEEDIPKIIIEIEGEMPIIEERQWIKWLCNYIPLIRFTCYRQAPMDETNEIILAYNACILPHITIDPIPNIYSLWGITVFIIFVIYYIIWGVWALFISIIYCLMIFLSMFFIIPYIVYIVVSEK